MCRLICHLFCLGLASSLGPDFLNRGPLPPASKIECYFVVLNGGEKADVDGNGTPLA